MLQACAIRDLLDEGVTLKWVHSGAQVADALTKVMNSSFLRQTLEQGKYQLFDQHQILKNRASDRNHIKWLQHDQQNKEIEHFGSVNVIMSACPHELNQQVSDAQTLMCLICRHLG